MNLIKLIISKFTKRSNKIEAGDILDMGDKYFHETTFGKEYSNYTRNLEKLIINTNFGSKRYTINMSKFTDDEGTKIRLTMYDTHTNKTLPPPDDEIFETVKKLNIQHELYQKELNTFIDVASPISKQPNGNV